MTRKTSVSFDPETREIIARRMAATGQSSVSSYLAELVRRDDQEHQLALDAQALHNAGLWGEERLNTINDAAARSRVA